MLLKKRCILALIICFFCSCLSAKRNEAIITFSSDVEVNIDLFDPIDGTPNTFYITKKIHLEPNTPVEHRVNIDDFAYFEFEFQDILMKYKLLLLEGNKVEVNYVDGQLFLVGDNAKGNEYLHDNFVKKGISYYFNPLILIAQSCVSDSIDFEVLDDKLKKHEAKLEYKKDLSEMLNEGQINEKFHRISTKTLAYRYKYFLDALYMIFLQGSIKEYAPIKEEREKLFERIDWIYSDSFMLSEEAIQHPYFTPSDYYIMKYRRLGDIAKEQMLDKYGATTFGNYIGLMQAPDHIQLAEIGCQAIAEFQNGVGSLYNENLVKWFKNKFPNKEYTAILTKLWEKKILKEEEKANAVFLNSTNINSFEDLTEVQELQGKKLYIDMWASWCSPCLAQFKYNEQTDKLLKNYDEIETVYISIDEDENDLTWKKQIDFHKLDGYHLRTSKTFVDYLSKKLYDGKSLSIPRYLLLDKDGSILNDNLPRPSEIEDLKKALNDALLK